MKKIISILLAVSLVLLLAACAPTGETVDITKYQTAVASTTPTSVGITTTIDSVAGVQLAGAYDIDFAADGSATISYTYEKLNDIASGSANYKETVGPLTATIAADGTVSGDDIPTGVVAAAKLAINLDAAKLQSTIDARGILTATVLSVNTASVLGFSVGADVSLELRINSEGKIGSASINYTTDAGLTSIVCIYE